MMIKHKFESARITKSAESTNENEFDVIVSTEDVDVQGEIVSLKTWNLERFKDGGPVLWNHDSNKLPIAIAKNVRVDGDALKATIEFDTDEFSQSVKAKAEKGFIKGISAGFVARKATKEKAGDKTVYRLSDTELLEVSLTTLPANHKALIDMAKKKSIETADGDIEIKIVDVEVDPIVQVTKAANRDAGLGLIEAWKSAFDVLPNVQRELDELKAEKALFTVNKKEALIKRLRDDGKATPIQEKSFASDKWSIEMLEAFAESAPVVLNRKSTVESNEPNIATVESFEGKSVDELVKNADIHALARLASSDKELFQKVTRLRSTSK